MVTPWRSRLWYWSSIQDPGGDVQTMSQQKDDALKEAALQYHELPTPGKLSIRVTKPMATQRDLSLAYSPGVAEACLRIAETEDDVFRYTGKGNRVAIITNGTAVLGLGDIGPAASKPVIAIKNVPAGCTLRFVFCTASSDKCSMVSVMTL